MAEKYSLIIINCLKTEYGIEISKLTFLPLGADMSASVYKAQTDGGLSYFVKLKRGHYDDISTTILTLLHNAGIKQIISPIKTIHGQSTLYVEDFTLIVYPFVEGRDGFSSSLADHQWVMLGEVLRQVHEFEVPPFLQKRIRRELYSPKWRQAVRSIYAHMETELTHTEMTLAMVKLLKMHQKLIYHMVDRAEQLGKQVQALSPKFVLCHSDIHGGNVLIEESGAIYIVDWDEPIMAPKERDLMFIGGGVANVWNNPLEEEFFYKGYGATQVNRTIMAYYRYERIVEDIALYAKELLSNTVSTKDRTEMYRQFTCMFMPRGVVEIALETDKDSKYSLTI